MKRCLIYIGALLFSLVPLAAMAQIPGAAPIAYLYCYIGSGSINSPVNWTACDAANPLNITGSFSASTSATAASALPTISAGAGAAVYESLAGALYVQPVFSSTIGGGTQVDATHGLPVNIVAGAGSGGTAIADGATFTEASTSFTPIGGEYVSGGGASCTTGKGCTVQMTIDRMAYVNIGKVGGAVTGTAGSAGTGVLTVQGIASMTPLLANPGTIATWGLATVAAGTAPTNALIGGAIYNSSPLTLTTGQSAALQSDANGFLKVNVAAGATVGIAQGASYSAQTFTPIMGLASTNAPTATTGDLWALSISPASGGVRIDLKDSATNTNAFAVTGPSAAALATAANQASNAATTAHTCSVAGFSELGCLGQIDDDIKSSIPAGSNLIGNVNGYQGGSALSVSNPSFTEITDGTNGAAAIKASTTAAAATDKSLVVQISPNQPNVPTINGANFYQAEPASTTITALTGGSGGASGDYLSHCTVIPTTTSPGVFTITDGSTAIYSFPGGASSLSNLVPWTIPVGAKSATGAWKVTTGAGLSIVCVGKFT